MLELRLLNLDTSRGVKALAEVYEAEVARLQAATVRAHAYLESGANNRDRMDQLDDDMRPDYPVWWRIAGVHFWLGEDGLAERRAGLRRLIATVEAIYRAELALRAVEPAAEHDPERPAFYDPWREICRFLELPLSKLSQLCLELTGLRIHELGDVVRAEGFRATLAEKLQPLVAVWRASLHEKQAAKLGADSVEDGWQFLKWVRGRGRAGNRRKWAWDVGIATAARLNKAVYQETGQTLEELEAAIAIELIEELLTTPQSAAAVAPDSNAQSAELSDVGTLEKVCKGDAVSAADLSAQSAGLSDVGEVATEASVPIDMEAA